MQGNKRYVFKKGVNRSLFVSRPVWFVMQQVLRDAGFKHVWCWQGVSRKYESKKVCLSGQTGAHWPTLPKLKVSGRSGKQPEAAVPLLWIPILTSLSLTDRLAFAWRIFSVYWNIRSLNMTTSKMYKVIKIYSQGVSVGVLSPCKAGSLSLHLCNTWTM